MPAKIAILISGNGSNMIAIHRAIQSGQIMAELTWIGSDNKSAKGMDYARKNMVPSLDLPYGSGQEIAEKALLETINHQPIDILCLAGFMQILSARFVVACTKQYQLPIINIHPSLLPALKGLNTHQRALDAGHEEHGCTVHIVNEKIDDGAILAQSSLNLRTKMAENINAEQLAAEVLKLEHVLYPQVIKEFVRRFNEGKEDATPLEGVKKYVGG